MIRPLVCALAVGLGACSVATRIDTLGPDFTGVTTVRMRGNLIPTPLDGIGGMELNAEVRQREEQPNQYALLVEVRADGLRIRGGESLRLVLDGDTMLLRRDSVTTAWTRLDPLIREQARYPVSDSVMLRLPTVQDASIAVRGAGWWEERRLSIENLATLQAFVRLQVPLPTEPSPAAPPPE